jgi:hypothetical protein
VAGNGLVCAVAEWLLKRLKYGRYVRGVKATTSRPNLKRLTELQPDADLIGFIDATEAMPGHLQGYDASLLSSPAVC